MAITTYRTEWGADTIEISANFAEASCSVAGTNGRQVADFCHDPEDAMRYAIEREARAEGLDPEDDETEAAIDAAVANMEEVKVEVKAELRTIKLSEIADEATSNVGDDVEALDPDDARQPAIVEESAGSLRIVDGFHRTAGQVAWCRENDIDLTECEIIVVVCATEDLIADAAEPGERQQAAIDAIYEAAGV
jgi:hypothetical protein